MSTLKIIKGVRPSAVRALLYGVEGIGKSTLGAQLPNSLFLDVEGGTNQLDVARVDITTGAQLGGTLAALAADPQGFANVVIDTADWAERLLLEELLKRTGKKSIEDFGFGKGYTHIAEEFSRVLTLTDGLINKGVNVVWLAHSKTVRVSPPDQTDGYDRYELKLSKQIAPLLKEWADLVLFAKFEVKIVEGTDGRVKAQGGKLRVLHTTHSAAWDAKNRYGLPETIKLETGLPAELAAVFNGNTKALPAAPKAPTPTPTVEEAMSVMSEITPDQLAQLGLYGQNSVCKPVIEKALAHYGQPLDLLTEAQAAKIITRCQEEMNKEPEKAAPKAPAAGAFPWPSDFAAWLEANAATVTPYLVSIKWIQPGQTFRDMSAENAEKVVTRSANFARAAKINPMEAAA